jgi:hypothetical protein
MSRKWAYKPGEASKKKILKTMSSTSDDMLQKFLDLTEAYTTANPTKRTMVLNDNLETAFFIQIGSSHTEADRVDVFIWDGHDYLQIPSHLAKKVSQTYFDYVDSMSEVYEILGGGESE